MNIVGIIVLVAVFGFIAYKVVSSKKKNTGGTPEEGTSGKDSSDTDFR